MKKWTCCVSMAALVLGLAFTVGCDWSAGGTDDGFNTSQGAGVNINFSGVYDGALGGGRAVSQTSGAGAIWRLVISQGGNRVDVTDNQGSTYSGTVGSPGAVSAGSSGVFPAGAQPLQALLLPAVAARLTTQAELDVREFRSARAAHHASYAARL